MHHQSPLLPPPSTRTRNYPPSPKPHTNLHFKPYPNNNPQAWNFALSLSYPLYLTHWPVLLMIVASAAVDLGTWAGVFVTVAAVVGVSIVLDKVWVAPGEAWLIRKAGSLAAVVPSLRAPSNDNGDPGEVSGTPTIPRPRTLMETLTETPGGLYVNLPAPPRMRKSCECRVFLS